jgi:glucose/arabinose dehydrogenase
MGRSHRQSSMSKRVKRMTSVLIILLLGLAMGGCRSIQGPFHTTLDETPAPTTVPLSAARPTVEPATAIHTPAATRTPDPTTTVEPATHTPAATHAPNPPATAAPAPTRIVQPQEPINLPPGFGISVFSQDLSDPRMMALGPDGELYVAERGAGRIVRLPDRDDDGVADGVEVVASGLRAPSSIAFYVDGSLYVGETTRILRLSDPDADGVFQGQETVVGGLPSGGHSTRTVLFSPDGDHLYVSIGSSCNVCVENDERRASIMRYNPDGSGGEVYARGLRNAVGITFRPGTDELWATNNGRDWLGDDQPPETIYKVNEGDDAGWPRCHAGRIVDPDLGEPGDCEGVVEPVVEMQAHSAPLGLAFYTGQRFPEEYRDDLFVAFHGSWNRTVPTGYKLVRIPLEDGEPAPAQDFAVGWLRGDGSQWGRPVDVLTGPDGGLFVSDDGGGVIYRIFYAAESDW